MLCSQLEASALQLLGQGGNKVADLGIEGHIGHAEAAPADVDVPQYVTPFTSTKHGSAFSTRSA